MHVPSKKYQCSSKFCTYKTNQKAKMLAHYIVHEKAGKIVKILHSIKATELKKLKNKGNHKSAANALLSLKKKV